MINSRKRVEKNPPAETQRSERLPSASRTSNGTSSWPPNLGNPPPTAEPLRDWRNGVVQNQPLKLPRSLESHVGSLESHVGSLYEVFRHQAFPISDRDTRLATTSKAGMGKAPLNIPHARAQDIYSGLFFSSLL